MDRAPLHHVPGDDEIEFMSDDSVVRCRARAEKGRVDGDAKRPRLAAARLRSVVVDRWRHHALRLRRILSTGLLGRYDGPRRIGAASAAGGEGHQANPETEDAPWPARGPTV